MGERRRQRAIHAESIGSRPGLRSSGASDSLGWMVAVVEVASTLARAKGLMQVERRRYARANELYATYFARSQEAVPGPPHSHQCCSVLGWHLNVGGVSLGLQQA